MSFTGFFFGRNRKNNNGRCTSCGKLRCNSVRARNLAMEPLETRDLLSVTTGAIDNAEYAEIRAQYPDFNLPKLQADLNVMTITPDDGALSLADLKSAIADAGTTQKPDLILVRTSETANSVTYASSADEITINIDSTQYGSVTIIGWGEENFTLDANQQSRVMTVTGSSTVVNLGGLTITGGNSSASASNTSSGGGVCNLSGTLTVINSTISRNTANASGNSSYGGGIYNNYGTLTVSNSTISGNNAGISTSFGFGGGIDNNYGILTVTNSTISGNNVSGRTSSSGGGIHCIRGTSTITNSEFSGNTASTGGGIYKDRGTLTITNSTIAGNTASSGGGIYIYDGTLTVTNSTISGNTASSYGGGIFNIDNYGSATLTVTNSIVSRNYNGNVYGYLSSTSSNNLIGYDPRFVCPPQFNSNGKLTNAKTIDLHLRSDSVAIDKGDHTALGNFETDIDGAARIFGKTVDIGAYEYQEDRNDEPIPYSMVVNTLNDSFDLNDNEWSLREAIYYAQEYVTITFADNLEGKIVLTQGQLVIDAPLAIDGDNRITIDANQKSRVFYISAVTENSPVALVGLTIQNGKSSDGGGIYNSSGALTITSSTIAGNTASSGGGIYKVRGTLTITNSTIAENTASGNGGGIYIYNSDYNGSATLTVTNSTIAGNTAYSGGGISNSATLTVTNSTITENTASGNGGGIFNSGTLTVTNSTISRNSVYKYGGGIYQSSSSSTIKVYNTIIAGNTAGNDGADVYCSVMGLINAYNSLSSYTEWDDENDNVVYDQNQPLFIDANNGDYHLAIGSQAIDKGNKAYAVDSRGVALAYDLDGFPRIVNGTVDIGAYEFDVRNQLEVPEFTLTANGSAVTVTISEVQNASSYTVLYQIDGADSWRTITNIQGASATFVGNVGTRYNVKVQANGNEYYTDSNYSAVQRITIADDLTAQNDFVKTTMNSPVVIDYRANDEATDWSVVTVQFGEASHGEYVVNENGTIVYTPDEGFFGMDSVPYTIYSPTGKTSLGSITISVEPSVVSLNVPVNCALSAEETTVTATWSRVNNASSYTVMYQIDGADGWTTIADIQGTSTSFFGVAGKKYNVKVQANGIGNYSDSEFSEAKSITLADPSTPLIGLTLSNYSPEVGSVITASLNPENATANYQWYCGETLIVGATTSSFTVTENQINQTITCVATGTGDYAGSVNATTAPVVALKLKTPSISSLSNNGTIVTASWAAVENASSYAIEYQLDGSDRWTTIGLQNTTALFIGEMGKTYNVRVKAVGTGVYADSAYSETEKIKLLIPLSVPQLYNVTTVGMEMNVVWSNVNNSSGYAVEYKLGDSDWSVLTTTNETTASLIGQPGSEYAFRVKAIGTGVYADSAYSQVKTVEIDDALDAQNDFVKTTLNTPAVIDYRANDEATDWSLTTVQFGKASHGEYTVNEDGTIVYTPEEGFYGTDGIGYVLVSPSGKLSPSFISISVGLPIATSVQKTSGDHTPSTAIAASVDSLTEWDCCYIELWAQGVNELSAGETTITMSYNPAIYSAPTFAACADGAVLSVSQGVELPDGSVQVELTVSTTQALSSQTDNLFLGTVVLTPSMEEGAGIADPLVSESICTLDGVNLTTTVETMSYDLTHSGKVDVDDFVAFAIVFGLKPGNMSPDNPLYAQAVKADFNKDGVVNSDDFIAFSINFGASKAATVKPVAQPSATAEQVRNDEVDASECEIRNTELIDSQVEFSEMELAVPTVQPASPISQSSPCGESVIPFASLTPLPPSNHSTLEAYSAALLDLYDNQDRADLTGSSDVLAESRMDAPIFGVNGNSSQNTSNDAIDAVLQEDILTIDWKE